MRIAAVLTNMMGTEIPDDSVKMCHIAQHEAATWIPYMYDALLTLPLKAKRYKFGRYLSNFVSIFFSFFLRKYAG